MAEKRASKSFATLAFATAGLTFGLIVFGAVVRVTESGLGCGDDWPLCNGMLFPPLDDAKAWIEWLHRLFAALIGLFGIATLALAWRHYREGDRRVLRMTGLAALLFLGQSGLGAIVVVLELPPTFVTLHLAFALLLLAALLWAGILARYRPCQPYPADSFSTLVYVNAGFALLIALTGALVRGSGATLACTRWPLCSDGALFPLDQGMLTHVHMLHRLSVVAMLAALIILVALARRGRSERLVKRLAMAALHSTLLQIGVGALFVLSAAGAEWGALHVGLAAAVWGLLAALAAVERMNHIRYRGGVA